MKQLDLKMNISCLELNELVYKQLSNNFILRSGEEIFLKKSIEIALHKINKCFSENRNKYYSVNEKTVFNVFNSGQYTIFLYYVSHILYKIIKNEDLAARVYYLNKMLNGVDLFYAIELPDVFGVEHPVGAVMGRAQYSNYFFFYQNVTVGGNKGKYPEIGNRVVLFANATVLGNSKIGNNCLISANSYIKDMDIPNNTIVYGSSPCLTLKMNQESLINSTLQKIFR